MAAVITVTGRTRWAQAAFGQAPWKTELFQARWLRHGAEPLQRAPGPVGGSGHGGGAPGPGSFSQLNSPCRCLEQAGGLKEEAWLPWEPRA